METIDDIYKYLSTSEIDSYYEKRFFFIKDLVAFNELGTILYFENEPNNYYFYNKLFHILGKKYLVFFVSLFLDNILLLPKFIVNLCIYYDIYITELQPYFHNILLTDHSRSDIYKLYQGDMPEFWELYQYLDLDYNGNYDFVYKLNPDVISVYEQHNNIVYTQPIENNELNNEHNEMCESPIEIIDDLSTPEMNILEYLVYKCSPKELDIILQYFGEELIYRLVSNPESSDYSLFLYEYYFSNIIKNEK